MSSSTLLDGIKRLGFLKGMQIYRAIKRKSPAVKFPELQHPVILRPGSTDYKVLKQVYMRGEYDIEFPFRPRYIIDGGANIGLFAILFANRAQDAAIVSIEPESDNFRQLKANTAVYPNVTAIQAGLWNKQCHLQVIKEGLEDWSFQVQETDDCSSSFPAISINDIMTMYQWPHIDIVKLDVEGAEEKIFASNFEWLAKTRVLIIELHDKLLPGSSNTFRAAMQQYDFTESRLGENLIFRNNLFN
ncbi:FkbM family methyltransferase [Chitinophaga solisilvae]|uniref:FkbM family methyltransferase n=1 Tax=Chitinophaga solisilvae TaxID=1233460 RepID=A0A433WJ04_9BACT|nr:FkbM family methyltransferase [Chitinophaga solisilvae]NSL89847.1 FkbM family methyltransferase [Chitinophaga solisilvae]